MSESSAFEEWVGGTGWCIVTQNRQPQHFSQGLFFRAMAAGYIVFDNFTSLELSYLLTDYLKDTGLGARKTLWNKVKRFC